MVNDDGQTKWRGQWLQSLLSGGNSTPGWFRDKYVRAHGGAHNATSRAKLEAAMRERRDDGPSLGWPDGPDIVVFNSGVHDLNNMSFTLDAYERRLRETWRLIADAAPQRSRGPQRRRRHYIWMSVGSTYFDETVAMRPDGAAPSLVGSCLRERIGNQTIARKYIHPKPMIMAMNVIGAQLAREYGADVLDQEGLRDLAPYDGDRVHCLGGLVCGGTLDSLVRLIELGPPTPAG